MHREQWERWRPPRFRSLPAPSRGRARIVFAGDGRVEELRRRAAEVGPDVVVHSWLDREERDRYGRLLAYVYRESDGLFVNAALVQGGYARTLTIAPNTAHEAEFASLAAQARTAGRGLWSRCG